MGDLWCFYGKVICFFDIFCFKDTCHGRGNEKSEAAQNSLIKAMLEWCDKPDSRSFDAFLDDRCIHEATMYEWCDKYPEIAETVKYVKTHIGIIRENGMADRKYDPRAYEMTQRLYSTPWRACLDEDYERRQALADTSPGVTVLNVIDTLAEELRNRPQISTKANDSSSLIESTSQPPKLLTEGE